MKRTTILLADDHAIVREGFHRLFELEKDFQVVGEAQDGRATVALARKLRPDVVLLDIAMPRLNGLEAARQMRKAVPATKVLILSAHSDDAYIENAIESGAAGFLLKHDSADIVCRAIREVQKGKTFFSPRFARQLRARAAQSTRRDKSSPSRARRLSSRETEVLQLVAEGRANKQMAAELGISIKTVEKHRENLMTKLGIHDIAGLTRHAIKTGLIEGGRPLNVA